jgi:type II secretory pathway pseudopilin PulG
MVGRGRRPSRGGCGGVVLLGVLLFILLSSLAAGAIVSMHVTQARRDREEQLLFAGMQFQKAITSYYNSNPPGGSRKLPDTLDSLVHDDRFEVPVPHLRRLYVDPTTGKADWVAIRNDDGRIVGVHSRSGQRPLKIAGFPTGLESFRDAASYGDWAFTIRAP